MRPVEIVQVTRFGTGYLYWPALDVDLHLDSIERPNDYPLVAKA